MAIVSSNIQSRNHKGARRTEQHMHVLNVLLERAEKCHSTLATPATPPSTLTELALVTTREGLSVNLKLWTPTFFVTPQSASTSLPSPATSFSRPTARPATPLSSTLSVAKPRTWGRRWCECATEVFIDRRVGHAHVLVVREIEVDQRDGGIGSDSLTDVGKQPFRAAHVHQLDTLQDHRVAELSWPHIRTDMPTDQSAFARVQVQ